MDEQTLANAIQTAISQGISAGLKAYGTKAPGTTPSATGQLHGVGGLFGVPGLDEDVISARVVPQGISTVLPVFPDIYAFPEFAYITGIEEDGDDEPTTECATCPSGTTESCIQSACWGYVCRETKTMTPSRGIDRINRGEFDLRLVNDIMGLDMGDPWTPGVQYDRGTILQQQVVLGMLEIGALMQNALVPMIWQGNPANNIGTGYAEFNGLGTLIGTGKVDYHTGTTCPALDSDVKDFNYRFVNNVDANGNFRLVRYLSYLEQYVHSNARRMGMLPVEWAWAMREELWYELTEVWPLAYLSTRNVVLTGATTTSLDIDAGAVAEIRDSMREGMYLYTNGRRHPVVLDDGIYEYNSTNDANLAAGQFASDIFLVPLTYLGGRPATYLQHKDYRAGLFDISSARLSDEIWLSDGGRFMWTVERTKFCFTLSAIVEPRVVLRTPQLAGRLNHVAYEPLQHFRDPFQDSDYFYKVGEESRAYPFGTVYPEHQPSRGVTVSNNRCDDT